MRIVVSRPEFVQWVVGELTLDFGGAFSPEHEKNLFAPLVERPRQSRDAARVEIVHEHAMPFPIQLSLKRLVWIVRGAVATQNHEQIWHEGALVAGSWQTNL